MFISTCHTDPWWWTSLESSAPCRTGSCPRTRHTWTLPGPGRGTPWRRPAGPRSGWGSPGASWVTSSVSWIRGGRGMEINWAQHHFFGRHCTVMEQPCTAVAQSECYPAPAVEPGCACLHTCIATTTTSTKLLGNGTIIPGHNNLKWPAVGKTYWCVMRLILN